MKPMNQRLAQFGIIGISAILTITAGLFAFQTVSQWNQASVLTTPSEEDGSVSYEKRISKGDELFEYGYIEEALTEYAYAAQLEPEKAEVYTKLSLGYKAVGDFEKAKLNAEKAYTLDPSDETVATYAHSLLDLLAPDQASTLLTEATGENQALSYVRGLLAIVQEDAGQAQAEFEKALSLSGKISPALLQNLVNAYTTYNSAQGSDTSYRDALICKALIDAEEYVLAQELALKTLNQKNDYRDVWMLLGYAQLELKNYLGAEDSFRSAKKIDSTKPEVHYFLASTLALEGKHQESIGEMELALLYGFEPESEAYKNIAESQSALGNAQEALSAYEAMLNVDASTVNEFIEPIETAIEEVKDLDRALTLAQKALTTFPSEAMSHTLLAQVYLAKGETDLANDSIQTAFDINPNLAEAHLIAGQVREQESNTEGAKWEYKKAFELSKAGDEINQESATRYNLLMNSANPEQ